MLVLKIIGKICVLPLIVVLAILLVIVKIFVGIYNFARALFGLLIGALIILTIYYYQDWLQIGLLVTIAGASIAILVAGLFLEVMIETTIKRLGMFVIA